VRLLALLLGDPGDITRSGAQDEARRELRKAIYHVADPSPVQRFMNWLFDKIGRLLDGAVRVAPGGLPSLVGVVIVIVAIVVALRLGLGPARLRDALTDRRRGAAAKTAAEYRAEAETLAAQGKYKDAIRARFRAIVRELEERGVLDPRPGRTAGEIAREAGAAVRAVADDLRTAAAAFDEAWYGRRDAGQAEYARVAGADERIRAARLVTADA